LRLDVSSNLGSGGIWGRDAGDSELADFLFRANARPSKPAAIKIAPRIISQYGNPIEESRSIYFSSTFSSDALALLIWGAFIFASRWERWDNYVAVF
jgi:hypothetical protein